MFQTIEYKNGHIQLAYIDGKEEIIAKTTIRLLDNGGTVWDYRRKQCTTIQSAKLWITKQQNDWGDFLSNHLDANMFEK